MNGSPRSNVVKSRQDAKSATVGSPQPAGSVASSVAGTASSRVNGALAAATAAPLSRVDKVDVAIVGAGLSGLACAAALLKVYPDCTVKVYEKRVKPTELSEDSPAVGGGVRIESNGLKALTAISRKLGSLVMQHGLYSQRVLLHDTEAGNVITHLHEHPQLYRPSTRQPALVVGWAELQQMLLDHLPPDTVQWGTAALAYVDSPSTSGVTLHVMQRKQQQQQQDEEQQQHEDDHGDSNPRDHWQQRQNTIHLDEPPSSPFHAVSQQQLRQSMPSGSRAASSAATSTRREQGLAGHAVADVEHVVVQARLLIAADGHLSVMRQQLVGDGPPDCEGALRWVGRLPGDLLSTIPVDYEAWWLGPGMVFNSHPLSGGDVAWEAQVSGSSLAAAGLKWDQHTCSLVPTSSTTQPGSSTDHQQHGSTDQQQQQQGPSQDPAAAAPGQTSQAEGGTHRTHHDGADGTFSAMGDAAGRAAGVAAPPMGDLDADTADQLHRAAATAHKTAVDSAVDTEGLDATTAGTSSNQASPAVLLQQLFCNFPAPVLDMLAATPPSAVQQAVVLTRTARSMPTSLGRGAVAVLGEAAHPLRPTGQEISQAFEDAAELGGCVMACGVGREALRMLELRRRPRWKHIMQVSQALGTCSNLGGMSLHQGLLDYTAQLYLRSFTPLRTMHPSKPSQRQRVLRWMAYGLIAWGAAAGVNAVAHRHVESAKKAGKEQGGPVGKLVAGVASTVQEAGNTAGKLVEGVTKTAANVPDSVLKAVNVGSKASSKAEHGLGSAINTIADVAEETANGAGSRVVHGLVQTGNGRGPGMATRFRNAVVGRTVALGGWLSKPFGSFMKHRVVHEVAETLGAF